MGRIAKDPQNNLRGLTKRYEAGERNTDLLSRYLTALSSAYMQEKQGAVAAEYLNALSDDEIVTKDNWELIKKNVSDPLSKPIRQVIANIGRFYEVAGKEVVDYNWKIRSREPWLKLRIGVRETGSLTRLEMAS